MKEKTPKKYIAKHENINALADHLSKLKKRGAKYKLRKEGKFNIIEYYSQKK